MAADNTYSPRVKSFSCPNCAGSVNIRAIGASINVVCAYCSSIIDTSDENYKVVDTFIKKIQRRTIIPLGQRGTLFGTLWETIGYMERTDQEGYSWSEYLLFNPLKGFRWLSEFNGHWSFVTMIKDHLKIRKSADPVYVPYNNKDYTLFNAGKATVTFVIGEFYWQVRMGETVNLEEYISPPETLGVESTEEEIVWSVGTYVTPDEIKNAFQLAEPMPLPIGVAPNQPGPVTEQDKKLIQKYWKWLFNSLIVLQIGICFGFGSNSVYKGEIDFTIEDKGKAKVTTPFEIKDRVTSIDIELASPVNNSWVEISGDLVNDETGEVVEFEKGIEYYSGVDSDGSWSEGSTSTTADISGVRRGKYHLNIELLTPAMQNNIAANPSNPLEPTKLAIEVKTGSTIWSNFFLAQLLLCLIPFYVWLKSKSFENKRWANSNFSPSTSDDSESEDDE